MLSDRQIVGIHEAGHAVVALFLHVGIREMSIEGTRGNVRDALCGESLEGMEPPNAAKHVQILLGGEIAVRMLYELHDWEYDDAQSMAAGANGDDAKIVEIASHFYGNHAPEWIAELSATTEQIVVNNWNCIEALAIALAERGHLSGLEVRRIIEDAMLIK